MTYQSGTEIVHSILRRVDTTMTAEEILGYALQKIKDSFDCLAVAIVVVDRRRRSFKVVNSKGWSYEFVKALHARPFAGLVADMMDSDGPITLTAGDSDDRDPGYVFEHDFTELIAVPMGIRGRRIGFLYLSSSSAGAFKGGDRELLADLASLCTLVLDHGSLGDQVLSMSQVDHLTGLYSYKYWHEELHRETSRSDAQGLPLALMNVSVNRFKEFNSMYGHTAGDDLLVRVSDVIRHQLAPLDVPCRVGSKWHAVLVGNSADNAALLAQDLLAALKKVELPAGNTLSMSIGLSPYRQGEGEKALIARVDDALREARRSGGTAIHITAPGDG